MFTPPAPYIQAVTQSGICAPRQIEEQSGGPDPEGLYTWTGEMLCITGQIGNNPMARSAASQAPDILFRSDPHNRGIPGHDGCFWWESYSRVIFRF